MNRPAAVAGLALVALAAVGIHTGLAGASGQSTPPRTPPPVSDHFQQPVSMHNNVLQCESIVVPTTRMLTLKTVLVNAGTSATTAPRVWVDVRVSWPTHSYHLTSPVTMRTESGPAGPWTGELSTTLHSGPADPQGASYSYMLCMRPEQGSYAHVQALFAGELDPQS